MAGCLCEYTVYTDVFGGEFMKDCPVAISGSREFTALVTEEGYGNPDADYVMTQSMLEAAGIPVVGISNECTGRDGFSQPLMTLDKSLNALVSTGNVSQLIELPPAKKVIGNLHALCRDGMSGSWANDEKLGPSVRPDGSVIMEGNNWFCGDHISGLSTKTVIEF